MDVYKIESDHSYKNITGKEDSVIGAFFNYKGQALGGSWSAPEFGLVENITKVASERNSEKAKDINFDARCYGNILILESTFSKSFDSSNIEFLPVNVEGIARSFVFGNVLSVIEAINFEGKDYKQSMDMIKSNAIEFVLNRIENSTVFRDKKLINFYYCTAKFIQIVNNNNIKGLRFDKVGEAS